MLVARQEIARNILKRVGIVLIIVGCVDIALMIYCIATETSYGSSLNVFAIVAGIFLIRGSLRAAKIVSDFSAFLAATCTALIVALPIFVPINFIVTLFRIEPTKTVAYAALMFLIIALLWWVHAKVSSVPVVAALKEADLRLYRRIWSILAGVALVTFLVVFIAAAQRSESAKAQLTKIEREHGSHQRYFFSEYRAKGGGGKSVINATIVGYTSDSIRAYEVSWEE